VRYICCAGIRLSAVGLGTWQFASDHWGYGAEYTDTEATRIINRALDLGVNLIDTAESYAFGRAERMVGLALASRRSEAFIATKFTPVAPFPPIVALQGRASRRRLGVEAIDLYQAHRPEPRVPLKLQMADLRRLVAGGVIRHVGVSNYSLSRWQAAEAALRAPIVSNQVMYNLIAQDAARGLLPWAAEHDRIVIAHSPLCQGLLSATYGPTNRPAAGRTAYPLFSPDNLRAAAPLLSALSEVARAHGASPAQIALAWIIARPNVVAIPGARSVSQLEENVAAAHIVLNDDEQARLSEAGAAFHPLRTLPPRLSRRAGRANTARSLIKLIRETRKT
jgi:aryl-alcohol dehydrogenase-like predicted oxidoreductase